MDKIVIRPNDKKTLFFERFKSLKQRSAEAKLQKQMADLLVELGNYYKTFHTIPNYILENGKAWEGLDIIHAEKDFDRPEYLEALRSEILKYNIKDYCSNPPKEEEYLKRIAMLMCILSI